MLKDIFISGAMMVLSGEAVRKQGIRPQARLTGWAVEGVDPAIMGIGPVPIERQRRRNSARPPCASPEV